MKWNKEPIEKISTNKIIIEDNKGKWDDIETDEIRKANLIIRGNHTAYFLLPPLNELIGTRPVRAIVEFERNVSLGTLFVVTVIILALAYYIPLKGTWKFIKISLQNKTAEQKISLIKKQLNYPVWQLTGVLGVTFIATLFFIWKIV